MTAVAVIAVVLLLGVPPCPAADSSPANGSIDGQWTMTVDREPTGSAPGAGGAARPFVSLPATWIDLGLQGFDGTVWFRHELTLTAHQVDLAKRGDLGLLIGASPFGDYEIFAGGEPVGRSPGWSLPLAEPSPAAFNIPRSAVAAPGRLDLELRFRRIGWASDRADGGPGGDTIGLGSFSALATSVEAAEGKSLIEDVPYLILASLFLAVAMYHLQLFHRRPQRTEYLWFALTSLCFAANTFLISDWTDLVTLRADLVLRWGSASGHLAAASAIQFLWPFLSKPIPRFLRVYQISHVIIAFLVVASPVTSIVVDSAGVRMLWLVPLILLVAWLVVSESWRGNPEARTIGWGCLAVVAAESHQVAVTAFGAPVEMPLSLPPIGFAVAVGAMAVSISNRFQRVHNELDALRLHLEDMVRKRTADLQTALTAAEAGNEVKSAFLANVSHELRTPMNIIIGMTEMLLDSDLDDDGRDCVQSILTSSNELLMLITDVLEFTENETGKVKAERVAFNPGQILEESVHLFASPAAAKGLTLDCQVGDDTPATFIGDPGRIRRVLAHLLDNAVKFTDDGVVRARLSAESNGTNRVELHFAVSDTGIGIDERDQGALFELFRQVDGSLTRRHGGTGIGLALCKHLAELMGGRIWFESRVGVGSTFFLAVPGELLSPH